MTRVDHQNIEIVVENIEDGENVSESKSIDKILEKDRKRRARTITESLQPDVIMNAKTNIYTAQTKAQFFETISNSDFQDDENFTRAIRTMPMQQLSNLKKEPPKTIKTETQVLLHTPENKNNTPAQCSVDAKEVSEKIQYTHNDLKKMSENLKHMAEFKLNNLRNTVIPPFDDELAEFKKVRKLEFLLGVALTDYDMIIESEAWINEEKLRQHNGHQLEAIKHKHKKELDDMRKKKVNHTKCDKQIVELKNKNIALVDELSATERENEQLKEQIRLLQVDSSNKDDEFKLLMSKYKNIQIHNKVNLFNNHIGPIKDAEREIEHDTVRKDIEILSTHHERKPAWNKYEATQKEITPKSVFYESQQPVAKKNYAPVKKIERLTTMQKLRDRAQELTRLVGKYNVCNEISDAVKELETVVKQINGTPKRFVKEIDRVKLDAFKKHF
ncbi:hypothetical protein HDV01_007827 [Terramyces sp. JEL0728]|nr:hypothetical protein HDV01_007827 [Terramyces sp. JEL0728]